MDALFQMVDNPSPLSTCPQDLLNMFSSYENCTLLDFLKKCWAREPNKRPSAKALLVHPLFSKETVPKRKLAEDKLPVLQKKRNKPITRQITKLFKAPLNIAGAGMRLKITPIKSKVPQILRCLGTKESRNYHY
jgi:serine/threonine protein kinase